VNKLAFNCINWLNGFNFYLVKSNVITLWHFLLITEFAFIFVKKYIITLNFSFKNEFVLKISTLSFKHNFNVLVMLLISEIKLSDLHILMLFKIHLLNLFMFSFLRYDL
jgi:hypothetical protein